MSQAFLGTIRLVGFNFAPVNWALCQGQTLPISQYAALFSLLGTYFGGDGQRTFNLPDLRGRGAISQGEGPGLSNYAQGQTGGVETVTLNSAAAPAHTHTMLASANATTPNPGPGLSLGSPAGAVRMYGASSPTPLNPGSIGPFGSSAAHENREPYLGLNYIIALAGIFPTQN
jgi:microcystin-dependent protein